MEPAGEHRGQTDGGGDPADHSLYTCGGHPAPIMGIHAEHHQVFLYLDPDALTRNGEPRDTHQEDGTRVSLETVRRGRARTAGRRMRASANGGEAHAGERERMRASAEAPS